MEQIPKGSLDPRENPGYFLWLFRARYLLWVHFFIPDSGSKGARGNKAASLYRAKLKGDVR